MRHAGISSLNLWLFPPALSRKQLLACGEVTDPLPWQRGLKTRIRGVLARALLCYLTCHPCTRLVRLVAPVALCGVRRSSARRFASMLAAYICFRAGCRQPVPRHCCCYFGAATLKTQRGVQTHPIIGAGRMHLRDGSSLTETAPPMQYLAKLEEVVAEARVKPNTGLGARPAEPQVRNQIGELLCTGCSQYLPAEVFPRGGRRCTECIQARKNDYACTVRGTAYGIVRNARSRAKAKNDRCNLDMHDILDMILSQGGRCAYSGIPMEIKYNHSHWRVSLERMKNSAGYSRDNCVLTAHEFNSFDYTRPAGSRRGVVDGSAQWSAKKVRYVGQNLPVNVQGLEDDIHHALSSTSFKSSQLELNVCREWPRRWTLRARAQQLAGTARQRSAKWGHSCQMHFADILEMLQDQGGRCFYSGVPLQYSRCHTDWVMSIERLNNALGYERKNSVLIAAEFNTTDLSRRARGKVRGSAQWSLAKVRHVWGQDGCSGTA